MSGEKKDYNFLSQEEISKTNEKEEILKKEEIKDKKEETEINTFEQPVEETQQLTLEEHKKNIDLLVKKRWEFENLKTRQFSNKEKEMLMREKEINVLAEKVENGNDLYPETVDPKLDPNYSPLNGPIHRDDTV